jgi:hypothetical protein
MLRILLLSSIMLSACATSPGTNPDSRSPSSDPAARKFKYENRDNGIGLLINDMLATENKLKTADQIEKYHGCLLSGKHEARQSRSYQASYRYLIAIANESFNVPIAMLTCLCGRESRFEATEASEESSAKGICQALNESLADVNRWRASVPALKSDWEGYVRRLGTRLEHSDCASAPLTHETLMRCPSLGLGVASVYLKYVYSRVEKAPLSDSAFQMQGLNSLVTVAGSYYAGPGLAAKALAKSRNRAAWPRALADEVCVDAKAKNRDDAWIFKRLSILRNHMVAVRNCMQDGNWLDHQGKPLRGECASPDTPAQLQALEKFKAGIPVACER